jgi:Phosphoesterase family
VRSRPARTVLTGVVVAVLATGCSSSPSPELASPPLVTVPAPPTTIGARVTKVLTIVEENHSLQQMQTSMPFLSALATQYGYATGYTAVSHPSLPNYLALSGGSTFDITNDAAPARHPIPGESVFGQALTAGKTAKVYAESMPTNCALTNAGSYAVRHTGWAYYVDERAACQTGQVPMGSPSAGALAGDVAAGRLPTIGWAIPDLSHDGHDGTLAEADHWLAGWLRAILSGPDFHAGHLAVVITADEDDNHSGNQVLTVVAAPGVTGKVVTAALTHYSLTGLYDDVIGAAKLREAATAPSFAAAFGLAVGI